MAGVFGAGAGADTGAGAGFRSPFDAEAPSSTGARNRTRAAGTETPRLTIGYPAPLTRRLVAPAFERFREKHGGEGMPLSEGQIITLMAADWMSRN